MSDKKHQQLLDAGLIDADGNRTPTHRVVTAEEAGVTEDEAAGHEPHADAEGVADVVAAKTEAPQ